MADSERIKLKCRLCYLIIERDVLPMFIERHSRNKSTDLSWYKERLLKVKYEICIVKSQIEGCPLDYSDFVETYGSTCCDDSGRYTDEI